VGIKDAENNKNLERKRGRKERELQWGRRKDHKKKGSTSLWKRNLRTERGAAAWGEPQPSDPTKFRGGTGAGRGDCFRGRSEIGSSQENRLRPRKVHHADEKKKKTGKKREEKERCLKERT